ncbi:MAG: carboxypeptidase-like regulatory domain-containing protein [Bacteroidetes bacterium]|nr:carboxypeptidase-like regulatory domain-containing protein [Bacteroidota bacterium]
MFLALSAAIQLLANGQTTYISGRVTDQESGEPLAGSNIIVKNTLTGTSTDENGYFRLETNLPPPFILQVSNVGYR